MVTLRKMKLSGATMIETLIAMVVIMAVFVTGTMIYFNVATSGYSLEKLKADSLIDDMMSNAVGGKMFTNEKVEKGGLIVVKEVSPYNNIPELMHFHVEVYNQKEELILEKNELVLWED